MAFKMKAGKEGPMKKNFPSAFQKKGDKAKLKSMNAVHDAVTGDMTDQQLRDMAVSQHGGKSSKFNVDVRYLKKLRAARRTKDVEKPK